MSDTTGVCARKEEGEQRRGARGTTCQRRDLSLTILEECMVGVGGFWVRALGRAEGERGMVGRQWGHCSVSTGK